MRRRGGAREDSEDADAGEHEDGEVRRGEAESAVCSSVHCASESGLCVEARRQSEGRSVVALGCESESEL